MAQVPWEEESQGGKERNKKYVINKHSKHDVITGVDWRGKSE
jgi:hypothetical protein